MRLLATIILAASLAACGFQLRGPAELPFETIYVPPGSTLSAELKRSLVKLSKTRVVDDPATADAVIGFTRDVRDKVILSFNSQGRVQEYQLRYRIEFRVTDPKGKVFMPTSEIVLTRDLTYNDAQVLSEESEEALLYRDMQSDMVQQLLRRMATASKTAVAPPPPQ
jgi:LPS-assembly lipoprotein